MSSRRVTPAPQVCEPPHDVGRRLDPTREGLGLDLEIVAMSEREYYRSLAGFFAPIRTMVLVTAAA